MLNYSLEKVAGFLLTKAAKDFGISFRKKEKVSTDNGAQVVSLTSVFNIAELQVTV